MRLAVGVYDYAAGTLEYLGTLPEVAAWLTDNGYRHYGLDGVWSRGAA